MFWCGRPPRICWAGGGARLGGWRPPKLGAGFVPDKCTVSTPAVGRLYQVIRGTVPVLLQLNDSLNSTDKLLRGQPSSAFDYCKLLSRSLLSDSDWCRCMCASRNYSRLSASDIQSFYPYTKLNPKRSYSVKSDLCPYNRLVRHWP